MSTKEMFPDLTMAVNAIYDPPFRRLGGEVVEFKVRETLAVRPAGADSIKGFVVSEAAAFAFRQIAEHDLPDFQDLNARNAQSA